MFIKEYISKDYPIFNVEDSVMKAIEWVEDFGFTHIFLHRQGVFLGALSYHILYEYEEATLGNLEIHLEKFALQEDANMMDSVKLFYTFNTDIIPIIGKNQKYLGYISYDDVFNEFSKYPLFSENGAIIIIQTTHTQYSLAEVTRIVEENNEKLYGCFISSMNEDYVQITLKTSNRNLNFIEESFERYGYIIVHKYYKNEKEELLKNRFDFFQKYLQI